MIQKVYSKKYHIPPLPNSFHPIFTCSSFHLVLPAFLHKFLFYPFCVSFCSKAATYRFYLAAFYRSSFKFFVKIYFIYHKIHSSTTIITAYRMFLSSQKRTRPPITVSSHSPLPLLLSPCKSLICLLAPDLPFLDIWYTWNCILFFFFVFCFFFHSAS